MGMSRLMEGVICLCLTGASLSTLFHMLGETERESKELSTEEGFSELLVLLVQFASQNK